MPTRRLMGVKQLARKMIVWKDLISSKCIPAMLILRNEFALEQSMTANRCVDKNGNPIPWYTYPAIEYLNQLEFRDMHVYEFGCGNSSFFWAARAKSVISVEENAAWYQTCHDQLKPNMTLKLRERGQAYYDSILEEKGEYNVIVIDGNYDRDQCAINALTRLAPDGLIVLDNSDRVSEFEEYARAAQSLRDANLIQIDFMGFGPINNFTWCTSLFLARTFHFTSKHPYQPIKSIGTIKERTHTIQTV